METIRSRHHGLDYICRAELLHSGGVSGVDLREWRAHAAARLPEQCRQAGSGGYCSPPGLQSKPALIWGQGQGPGMPPAPAPCHQACLVGSGYPGSAEPPRSSREHVSPGSWGPPSLPFPSCPPTRPAGPALPTGPKPVPPGLVCARGGQGEGRSWQHSPLCGLCREHSNSFWAPRAALKPPGCGPQPVRTRSPGAGVPCPPAGWRLRPPRQCGAVPRWGAPCTTHSQEVI